MTDPPRPLTQSPEAAPPQRPPSGARRPRSLPEWSTDFRGERGEEFRHRMRAPDDAFERVRALLSMREDNLFLLLSVIIGLFSGLAVVCFRIAIDYTRWWLLGSGRGSVRVGRGVMSRADVGGSCCCVSGAAIFSACERQWRHANEVGCLHLRRIYPIQYRHREIPDLRAGHRQRAIAWARGSFAADRSGNCVCAGTAPAFVARKSAVDCAGWRGCGIGGGL